MSSNGLQRKSVEEIQSTVGSITKIIVLGALVATVGYLRILMAFFLELTQFRPLLGELFSPYTDTSLVGGGWVVGPIRRPVAELPLLASGGVSDLGHGVVAHDGDFPALIGEVASRTTPAIADAAPASHNRDWASGDVGFHRFCQPTTGMSHQHEECQSEFLDGDPVDLVHSDRGDGGDGSTGRRAERRLGHLGEQRRGAVIRTRCGIGSSTRA